MATKQNQQQLQEELTNQINLTSQLQTENNEKQEIITRKTKFINCQQLKISVLEKNLQLETELLDESSEILVHKNTKISQLVNDLNKAVSKTEELAQQITKLQREINKQNQANQKKNQQLKRKGIRLLAARNSQELLQQEANNKDQLIKQLEQENNQQKEKIIKKNTYIIKQLQQILDLKAETYQLKSDNQNLQNQRNQEKLRADNLQVWKDKHEPIEKQQQEKIKELETEIRELKDKPPVSPVNNFDKTEDNNSANSELNNLLTEKSGLLNTIQEQKETIQHLEIKLKEVPCNPREIIKKIPVENLTTIQKLENELNREKLKLTQLTYYCWLISVICILLLLVGAVGVKRGKNNKLVLGIPKF